MVEGEVRAAGLAVRPAADQAVVIVSDYAGWALGNAYAWSGVVRKNPVESDQDRWNDCEARGIGSGACSRTISQGKATVKTEWLMGAKVIRRSRKAGSVVRLVLVFVVSSAALAAPVEGGLGQRHVDPAQILPLDQIPPEHRESLSEVIRDHTFHRMGETDSFPCPGSLYLSLLNEPMVPLTLWKDLSTSPVQLQKVSPNRYEGSDGSGSTAVWDFVLRTPRLHVMLAYFNYVSPRGNARVEARIVLIVRSNYLVDGSKEPWVQHDVEAFVKVDSKGWKTLARTVRPVVEKVLEDQVREAGQFVSLMSRLVITYPTWACQTIANQPAIDAVTRNQFQTTVLRNQKAGASRGRPVVMQDPNQPAQDARRR